MHNIKKNYGVTLLELIVAIGITALILEAVILFVNQGYKSWRYTRDQSEVQNEGRMALDKIINEIRKSEDSGGAYAIEKSEPDNLTFFSNIDSDTDIEKIRYYLENNQLKKGVIHPVNGKYEGEGINENISIVANYIRNTDIFIYYGENYPINSEPVINVTDIRLIHLKFVIDYDPNNLPEALTLESSVVLRNKKTNL